MNGKSLTLLAAVLMTQISCAPKYPEARKCDTTDEYFGVSVADPYRWLEDDNSPETAAWVKAENRFTGHYLSKIKFRSRLLARLKEVADYEKVSCPVRHKDGKWYFYKNDGLMNQSVLYRADAPDAGPEVFLDPNSLSEDGTVALKGCWFSGDGRYAAYAISRSGSDWQEFYVLDARSGELLEDHIEWAKFSGAAWRGEGFYYSAYQAPEGEGHEFSVKNEGHKIYYHRLGTPQSEDTLFFSNPDEPLRFYTLDINEEETLAYLFEDGADTGNNLYVMDLRKPDAGFVRITKDMKHNCYPVADLGDKLYLFTNEGAPMNRLVVTDIADPTAWRDVLPEADCVLESVDFIAGKIIASYSRDASTHAGVYSLDGKFEGEVQLPGVGSASFTGKKDEPWCYYSYSGFTEPGAIYSLDMENLGSSLFMAPKTAFDLSGFETRQVFFASKDGTRVPMFIVCRKDVALDGTNPVYLYGYGGFDISLPPVFSSSMVPFLEAGGIYCQVNLRGGGEYGREWHLAGTKMNKQNVFDDFISAAQWLIASGYTSSARLAIVGGSNGGLLVGACMTQRPDLFAVAVPRVGVMDMLRYHKFTIGWNWAPDYGTSDDSPEMFSYLRSYSPLHNLRPGTLYPATLVTTADHDDRVVPAHSFKFAATLQECVRDLPGARPALIRIDSKAGHGGGKPMSKVLEEQADIFAFIMHNLGVDY